MTAAQNLSAAELLLELVRIPSVSSLSNRPLMEFIKGVLQPGGWNIRELPYRDAEGQEKLNMIATPAGQPVDNFSVDFAFVCHTDTVPYSPGWAGAVHPEIRDGQVHGCGACDVKGFLACLLAAFGPMRAQPAASLALAFTAEEEIGCRGARRLVEAGLLRARHAVIGEPTSLHPARAGKGYGLAEVRVFGKEAHSAYPAQGESAIYRAARLVGKIEELAATLKRSGDPLFDPPYTTLNVGTIEGGTAKNIVAGECRFLLEWRPIPSEATGAVPDAVRRLLEDMRREDPGLACELKVLREQAGFQTDEGSPLLRRWIALAGRHAVGVAFGTEAPLLATLAEDVIVVGPGDMRTAHSERECVPIAELERCVLYLRGLVAASFE